MWVKILDESAQEALTCTERLRAGHCRAATRCRISSSGGTIPPRSRCPFRTTCWSFLSPPHWIGWSVCRAAFPAVEWKQYFADVSQDRPDSEKVLGSFLHQLRITLLSAFLMPIYLKQETIPDRGLRHKTPLLRCTPGFRRWREE